MTLEEALLLIPTHIMLRPCIDKWQQGDEFLMTHDQYLKNSWEKAFILDRVIMEEEIGRRPIPEAVRKQMAQNISNWSLNSNFDEVNPFEGWLLSTQGESKR